METAKRAGFDTAVVLPEFATAISRFFAHGRFVQQAEKTNPLAFVSQLRRVVQCGFQRPGYEARNIHSSHFGRLCMLETPEGEKIGINLSAAILVQVDLEGRLLTPYRRRDGGEIEYLTAEAESENVIADLGAGDRYTARYGNKILAWTAR